MLLGGARALVLIEPLPVQVHPVMPRDSVDIAIEADAAHRFDLMVANGAFADTLAGDGCRAATAGADIGFAAHCPR